MQGRKGHRGAAAPRVGMSMGGFLYYRVEQRRVCFDPAHESKRADHQQKSPAFLWHPSLADVVSLQLWPVS